MEKISLLESVNPLLLRLGDTIEINHKSKGKINVMIGGINGKKVYWSTPDGLMGMLSSDNVIRVVEDQDLVNKYFPSNSKLSQFKVPLKIFRESNSGKAVLVGFVDFDGREQSIWVPKSTLTPVGGIRKLNGENYDMYNLAFFIFWDDKNKEFFQKYAKFYHTNEIMMEKDKFARMWVNNRRIEEEAVKKLNNFFSNNGLSNLIIKDSLEVTDLTDKEYYITCNGKTIDIGLTFSDPRITIDDEFLRDVDYKNEGADNLIAAYKIADYVGTNVSDVIKLIKAEYEKLWKSYDPNYSYSDDSRVYNYGSMIAEKIGKIKKLAESEGFYSDIKKYEKK